MQDSPLLDRQSTETKRYISAKVHGQFKADPGSPVPVEKGLILICRQENEETWPKARPGEEEKKGG